MSIIAEALRKAEGQRVPREKSKTRKEKRALPSFYKYIGLFALPLFLFLGVLLYYFLSQNLIDYKVPLPGEDKVAEVSSPLPLKVNLMTKVQPEKTPTSPSIPFAVNSERNVEPGVSHTLADVNESINLNGIMYTPKRPLAVINNSIWTEGDLVGEFKILKIEKDFVKFTSGDEEFVIRLKR